ncbi:hypothetical protein FRB93_005829 [Tulasnella sp. JGI-2019a]|nr:hypothetical protein FRB93_005829 [Tulasnella sp. JGI-2019a]
MSSNRLCLFILVITFSVVAVVRLTQDQDGRLQDRLMRRPSFAVRNDSNTHNRTVLVSPPTNKFRENLKPDVKYVTTWNKEGMTNQLETHVNLIYLGMISDRVPILSPFIPSAHLGDGQHPYLDFGKVYDMARLRRALQIPIVEWSAVKRAPYGQPPEVGTGFHPKKGPNVEELGCWASRYVTAKYITDDTTAAQLLQLDISFTTLPPRMLTEPGPGAYHVKFWGLASVLFPDGRRDVLSEEVPRKVAGGTTSYYEPDEQLACFDNLFGTSAFVEYEWYKDYSPAWRFVGRHVHFTDEVQYLVDQYLKKTLGVDDNKTLPPFIAVHIRRDDWAKEYFDAHPGANCWASLTDFAKHVKETQQRLILKFGVDSPLGNVKRVIVTSDERNATWWKEVLEMGWSRIDHEKERTSETLGTWWPTIIDAAVQSRAIGLVGTRHSTMSMVAGRRVQDWNGGVTAMVARPSVCS